MPLALAINRHPGPGKALQKDAIDAGFATGD